MFTLDNGLSAYFCGSLRLLIGRTGVSNYIASCGCHGRTTSAYPRALMTHFPSRLAPLTSFYPLPSIMSAEKRTYSWDEAVLYASLSTSGAVLIVFVSTNM